MARRKRTRVRSRRFEPDQHQPLLHDALTPAALAPAPAAPAPPPLPLSLSLSALLLLAHEEEEQTEHPRQSHQSASTTEDSKSSPARSSGDSSSSDSADADGYDSASHSPTPPPQGRSSAAAGLTSSQSPSVSPSPSVSASRSRTSSSASSSSRSPPAVETSEGTTTSVAARRKHDPQLALVIPQRTEVEFMAMAAGTSVVMEARVDTGASLTAIPVALKRELGLKVVRKVKIRTGIDHTERREVVMVGVRLGAEVYEVEASVRTGNKLGRIPILGRNLLALSNFLVSVETEDLVDAMTMPHYISWLDAFVAQGSQASPARADYLSPAHAPLPSPPSRRAPWWACGCCGRPPVADGGSATHARTAVVPGRSSPGRGQAANSSSGAADADATPRTVYITDYARDDADGADAMLRLPPSRFPHNAIDELLILEEMVDIEFQNPIKAIPGIPMSVRVDTGASMTAIPVAVARALRLKSQGKVRIRMGNDATDVRDVVDVDVVLHGKPYQVRASVRDGEKLGKTAILGRNLLAATHALIRVADPKRRSLPAKSKSKSKSKAKAKAKAKSKVKAKSKSKSKSKAIRS
ncbi:uncharacterized protein AMSG_09214 [Thecamonas trahens ATCC 50062]|uniref:Uncharacterized protein n=1 Tax=Thecamonas trahens ATCC 50062 TaxID=461836 RepID=A0A0L0DP04_THETB|nr:hypothetical protein AMSG_09214 [Thecamonas trahens ATCC 50062]KNC53138.1 hypothetical protein AMSG_09214 [Thecamonas trahens ATCC 50062]|eukprot:XP_013754612.1 hypothetical protein AMSG_09214 [Thecamonas trahens ATCC 50062]